MRSRVAPFALVLLAVAASGCYRWTDLAPTSPSITGALTQDVRVILTDGREIWLVGARVQHDSLAGDTLGGDWGEDLLPYEAIPLASVRSLAIYQLVPGRTALLVGGISVAVVAVAAFAIHSSGGLLGGMGTLRF